MKGGIAASILAAAALAHFREHWSGEVVITLAGDEETMGELGTGYLLKHVESVRRADAVICGDAGSPNIIRIGEKGLVWMDVEASGTAAHGAHVHKGDNAIERLMEALWRLKEIEKMPLSPILETDSVIDGAFAVSEFLGGEGEANTLKKITVNIGKISGGTSPNLVPDKATASLDIRLPDGVSTEELLRRARECLDDLRGITLHVRNKYEPSLTKPDEKIVQDAEAAVRAVISTEHAVNMRVGASDTRLFRRVDIPSVVIGLTPYNMGGPDEYCLTEELLQVCKIHALAAWRFLQ
jgi:succinyl-diaminopimelate desuccinylase